MPIAPLVDLVIEDPRWEAAGLEAGAEAAARASLDLLGLSTDGFEICVMGCDDARIAALNADFRGKPRPTNVLSWPSQERAPDLPGQVPDLPAPGNPAMPEELGDIAISYETCLAEAQAAGRPLGDHMRHLIVHGVLHLLGYDHETDQDAALMEGLEVKIMAQLGLPDPFAEAGTHTDHKASVERTGETAEHDHG
ncbi:MAG: rRNA maturation RNase YbeY [Mangrovicoccus sp.]|nr:rRNA maturation RNase YbeY [Mangrovicoccus sp.]